MIRTRMSPQKANAERRGYQSSRRRIYDSLLIHAVKAPNADNGTATTASATAPEAPAQPAQVSKKIEPRSVHTPNRKIRKMVEKIKNLKWHFHLMMLIGVAAAGFTAESGICIPAKPGLRSGTERSGIASLGKERNGTRCNAAYQ